MTASPPASDNHRTWLEDSGLLHIFRTLGMAVQPAKLGLALLAIMATFVFGALLDRVWCLRGGVDAAAIDRFIIAQELGGAYETLPGDHGIFEVWREHAQRSIFGLMGSTVPGTSMAAGTSLGEYLATHANMRPLRSLSALAYGTWWMCREHFVYFLLFGSGALLIWALGGGAICRVAAVQFARDEKLTMSQGLRFSRDNLFGGFVLAPCIPLLFAVGMVLLMFLFGLFLSIPVLGDVIGGLTFFLPVVGGFVVAILLVGLAVGGSLMWPAVAAEAQDAYDAFARSLSYAFSKPWKTLLYGVFALIYVSICWMFVNLFTYFALSITRGVVGAATAPFGWWGQRGTGEAAVAKLEALWPLRSPSALHAWPDWSALTWYDCVSAAIIGVHVMIVVGVMFAFLASFYYCASTVLYFLLRRDVDKTDLEDVFVEDIGGDMEAVGARVTAAAAPGTGHGGVSLPVVGPSPGGEP